ncbi:alkaline phosphatase [Nesidiocoris tenuis]|uniref:alkaline phosphatase n=1 Tax=Nesidiocoris tenuis TaxID=355587 RepID=A0ABN7ALC4_9HEMI|nr:alkaline phosphatase [Nesidiocoris tenuis]
MMSGIKGISGTMGTDYRVPRSDCSASLNTETWTTSNALIAQHAGKATGVVTNTRVTHATPASVYAHSAERDWECDSVMPPSARACKDIARQLIEDEPGRNLNVIMGGGIQAFISEPSKYSNDPLDTWACMRNDSRDLIREWKSHKEQLSASHAVVHDAGSLKNVDTEKTEYLLGLFGNGHMSFNYLRDKTDKGQPSLAQMATTAVKILKNNPNGFFLMVEGGLIDYAHHRGRAKVALDEGIELNEAVNQTVHLLEELNIKDETLLIVTSDHCHTLSINGYPERGSSMLGIADKSSADGISYTTLTYAVSGPENFQYEVVNGVARRRDPLQDDTTSWDYHQQATIAQDESKHGGGDVNIYATGPMAHLFHHVHEQSYVAHVVQYAAKMGRYKDRNVEKSPSSAMRLPSSSYALTIVSALSLALALLC